MTRKNYDQMILERVEKSFDLIIPISAVIAVFSSYIVSKSDQRSNFVYYDLIICLFLIGVYLLRRKIKIHTKIIIVALVTTILGTASLIQSGFSGTGVILIALSNLVIVSFLSKKMGYYYTGISILVFSLPPILLKANIIGYEGTIAYLLNNPSEWFLHIVAYLLFGLVMVVSINAIKDYLLENINEGKIHSDQLTQLAYYDSLTGIINKHRFVADMNKNKVEQGWVVLLSIRGLNLINSIYGSDVGDNVIKHVAKQLALSSKEGELVAKSGGNEFIWYSRSYDSDVMMNRLLILLENIHASAETIDMPAKFNLNIGFAGIDEPYENIARIIQKSSIALEQSKSSKGASITRYDLELENEFRTEEELRRFLLKGIENNEFYISYQEKRDCVEERVVGLEALARWQSPELGTVSPSSFIPVIEKASLSQTFGNMIIRKVLDEYSILESKYGVGIMISINISPVHLSSDEFSSFIIKETLSRNINPESIILEITEDSLIEDFEGISETLFTLRKVGYRISLDDFGTGYSSLSYLSRLGFDELKIDRSFVQMIGKDDRTINLVRAIINLKDTYGIDIVAEGVETVDQSEVLKMLGCNVHQGFLFSKPKPIELPLKS
ncbi:MAG: hypothetical protein BGO41_09835 [Clostridiales bacterium 38-18]|nr:MAG: hypothetical protein BGO41_09835 [Clostridiales bacterium 38-18]